MLIIVIENPIQFTIVSEDPLVSSGAFLATRVENNGESAITETLHTNRKIRKVKLEFEKRKIGERKQQEQEMVKAMDAIFFAPNF